MLINVSLSSLLILNLISILRLVLNLLKFLECTLIIKNVIRSYKQATLTKEFIETLVLKVAFVKFNIIRLAWL